MIVSHRWSGNRRVVTPTGAFTADLPLSRTRRSELTRAIRALPPRAPIVLSVRAPMAARRCRRFASRAGVEILHEYLALPSARAPAYLVEDAAASSALFVRDVLVAPPRSVWSAPVDAALVHARRWADPSRVLRALAPGRIVVGRRR